MEIIRSMTRPKRAAGSGGDDADEEDDDSQTAFELLQTTASNEKDLLQTAKARPVHFSHFSIARLGSMSRQEKVQFLEKVRQRKWVIDPRTTRWMVFWDVGMIVALLFTALVTPFQVAFLEPRRVLVDGPDALWVTNRIFDTFFIADVAIVCNTMYQEPLVDGGMWVHERSKIVSRYLRSGWLLIDAVSCFPYFVIGIAVEASVGPLGNTGSVDALMPLRLVKLVRMLKLTRCLKASAKLGPYVQEVFMGTLEFTYGKITVASLFLFLAFFTHLQACFWALGSSFTAEMPVDGDNSTALQLNWIQAFSNEYEDSTGEAPRPWDLYCAAIYWSGMTITSIGYGEMLPLNSGERVHCTCLMLISGMVWTFILSQMCAVTATLQPNQVLFQTTSKQRHEHLLYATLILAAHPPPVMPLPATPWS
jgi:hypothetical protein